MAGQGPSGSGPGIQVRIRQVRVGQYRAVHALTDCRIISVHIMLWACVKKLSRCCRELSCSRSASRAGPVRPVIPRAPSVASQSEQSRSFSYLRLMSRLADRSSGPRFDDAHTLCCTSALRHLPSVPAGPRAPGIVPPQRSSILRQLPRRRRRHEARPRSSGGYHRASLTGCSTESCGGTQF